MSAAPIHEPAERHFDRIAGQYNASLPPHVVAHYLRRRIARLRALVPQPGPVLDVGCGTGLLLWGLAQAGYDVTGLDASAGMLRQAPAGFPPRLLQASADAIPLRSGSFPLVVSVATFHHLVDPDVVRGAVREMVRVTAPGGACVIWDHNPRNPYWPLLMARVPQDQEHTRLVPVSELLAALDAATPVVARAGCAGWVPEFVPRWSLPLLTVVERALEAVPGVRGFGAHNVLVVRKG